ncbi:unnamed protein product [Vitrella brassicaformis CCMP3155]|uniref:Ketosynthase family 3 (KS3) domain-containing protein n=10 Tax=Vitrella brassicaformis TaxID=1169539 RepID=A0A0G4GH80_VITBC|nr:unnamed protein product [Vitrella brassicaformis CCMP3155]|eukprot:CEM29078.1 unnamed protein product [Vitrella brassicaformis CCMP3155]
MAHVPPPTTPTRTQSPNEDAMSGGTTAKQNGSPYVACFAGQAVGDYIADLRALYEEYPSIRPFVEHLSQQLYHEVEDEAVGIVQRLGFHKYGFDVMEWIRKPETTPPQSYLSFAPISFPMIFFVQMTQYLCTLEDMGMTPGEFRGLLHAAIGHSQGLVAAACIAHRDAHTVEGLQKVAGNALRMMFWNGLRLQYAYGHPRRVAPNVLNAAVEAGAGKPTPMLSIRGLPVPLLTASLAKVNAYLPPTHHVHIALKNGPDFTVVAGDPSALVQVIEAIKPMQAAPSEDQTRVPFSQRKHPVAFQFLDVSTPFHCSLSESAVAKVADDIGRLGLFADCSQASPLTISCLSNEDGTPLSDKCSTWNDVAMELVRLQSVVINDWLSVCRNVAAMTASVTHVLDFGPGKAGASIGGLTARNLRGSGIGVEFAPTRALEIKVMSLQPAVNWLDEFGPRVRLDVHGRPYVDTKFRRLLGRPPVMVAGMTPTTVKPRIVKAALKAGFHAEIAGGGQHTPEIFKKTVNDVVQSIADGEGVWLNLLFLNPFLWKMQYPLILQLRRDGWPILGVTVAAGVPSPAKADEILANFRSVGIHCVAFKPGSVPAIRAVLEIADRNPDTQIVVQWTGGRAGGHHSFEDQHAPILTTYHEIRALPNTILVAGGGIGDGLSAWKYLSGQWSLPYNRPPMPFDAILMGSRVMACEESWTADEVKEMIAKVEGLPLDREKEWEQSYGTKGCGGVLTVTSELGEPIHLVCNRAAKLWRELDDQYFNKLPDDQLTAALDRDWLKIAQRFNDDYQKLYFCEKKDGTIVRSLSHMTYEEVALRLINISRSTTPSPPRWLTPHFKERLERWLLRAAERLANNEIRQAGGKLFATHELEDDPEGVVQRLVEKVPEIATRLVCAADEDYFIEMCRIVWMKPPNFIPVIDPSLKTWLKKDSLSYSEDDIRFVKDRDPQRVITIHGPIAAGYTHKANEPISDILTNIHKDLIEQAGPPVGQDAPPPVGDPSGEGNWSMTLPSEPGAISKVKASHWLERLAGPERISWKRALLTAPHIVRDKRWVANDLARLFYPRASQTFKCSDTSILIFDPDITRLGLDPSLPSLEATLVAGKSADAPTVRVVLRHPIICCENGGGGGGKGKGKEDPHAELCLEYRFYADRPWAPIVEESYEDRCRKIAAFYTAVWMPEGCRKGEEVIDSLGVRRFRHSISEQTQGYEDLDTAPLEYAIVLAWDAILTSLIGDRPLGDLFRLVHLSNQFKLLDLNQKPFKVGDNVDVSAMPTSLADRDEGRIVTVRALVSRKGQSPLVRIDSSFLFRGPLLEEEKGFTVIERDVDVFVADDAVKGVLMSKDMWHDLKATDVLVGVALSLKVESREERIGNGMSKFETKGTITRSGVQIGSISLTTPSATNCPVLAFLDRHGTPHDKMAPAPPCTYRTQLDRAHHSDVPYAFASRDTNPLHVSPFAAALAGLDRPIVHGMLNAARARQAIEAAVGGPVVMIKAEFVGMVHSASRLKTSCTLIGTRHGSRVVQWELKTEDPHRRGNWVLAVKGTAEVGQPPITYLFTGQGSAEANMGMDLYNTSHAAQAVWDRADAFFKQKYAFSIIDIVKRNPKELWVSFLGQGGDQLRQAYAAIRKSGKDGKDEALFPEAEDSSAPGIRFYASEGLLFATQFTQPAILLFEKAWFEDLRAQGCVQPSALFAGHSLGEYAALCSVANVIPIETIAELVFLRGLTMQSVVDRDHLSRSRYGMVAFSPSRVGKWVTDDMLEALVTGIDQRTGRLLQVVNYNHKGSQYVIAGDLTALETLRLAADKLAKEPPTDLPKGPASSLPPSVEALIGSCWADALETEQRAAEREGPGPLGGETGGIGGFVPLQRGTATIPLKGIDIPFHSRLLRKGVGTFRRLLEHGLAAVEFPPSVFVGKYFPNLVGRPFSLTEGFIEAALKATEGQSNSLKDLLDKFDEWKEDERAMTKKLLICLLSWQFASPVQWIKTMSGVGEHSPSGPLQIIEIGPAPVLVRLARPLQQANPLATTLWITKDRDTIYCHDTSIDEDEIIDDGGPSPSEAAQLSAIDTTVGGGSESERMESPQRGEGSPVASAPQVGIMPVGEVVDVPMDALHALRSLLATRLHLTLDEVPPTATIRALCGGKSALQNEVVGDLSTEFGSEPEGASDKSLETLARDLGAGYTQPGKILTNLTSRMLTKIMPAPLSTVSKARACLAGMGLGENFQNGVLVHAVAHEPSSKFGGEGEGRSWLRSMAEKYADLRGVAMPAGGAAMGAGTGAGSASVAVIDAAALDDLKSALRRSIDALRQYTDPSPSFEEEQLITSALTDLERLEQGVAPSYVFDEHGPRYLSMIKPMFKPPKVRTYDSSWAWVRVDAMTAIHCPKLLSPQDPDLTLLTQKVANTSSPSLCTLLETQAALLAQTDKADKGKAERARILAQAAIKGLNRPPVWLETREPRVPAIEITDDGTVSLAKNPRKRHDKHEGFSGFALEMFNKSTEETRNRCFGLNRALPGQRLPENHQLDAIFSEAMTTTADDGLSFYGKVALVTGAAVGNIAFEVIRGLLMGGARVIVCTAFPEEGSICSYEVFKDLYQSCGSNGSSCVVVPMNGMSAIDCSRVIDHVFDAVLPSLQPLPLNHASSAPSIPHLDLFVPFAAIPETGRTIQMIDDRSEAAHRLMLTNVHRCIGRIMEKNPRGVPPCHVILPLSPNKGLFGGDGLYGESKIGLETLFAKWKSEGWQDRVSIVGAEMGWVRGTGVMSHNDMVAPDIEKDIGMRTFAQMEMGFTLLVLCHPRLVEAARTHPLRADLTGGFRMGAKGIPAAAIRARIMKDAGIRKAIHQDAIKDREVTAQESGKEAAMVAVDGRQADIRVDFPELPTKRRLQSLPDLTGMLDLKSQVVIVGFGEVGPWGSSRTRWEMEAFGKLTIEGALELARWMNLIKYHTGPLATLSNRPYTGWIDSSTSQPVSEKDILPTYHSQLLQHCGLRPIDPVWFRGTYVPTEKMFISERALEGEMEPFEVTSREEAEWFSKYHGHRVDVVDMPDGSVRVKLKEGAKIYVPKAMPFSRRVGGQLPNGFDPVSFGFPKDLSTRVDRVTQWACVAFAEALTSAGLLDPYELYEHVGISEVGTSLGSGMGGQASLRDIFRERWLENDVNGDALQETFVNTPAAWLNMLLVSSAGPVKPCAAACATAGLSVELGVETIRSGKAQVMITGGTEDFTEEGSFEFASMKATNDSTLEVTAGRRPSEASRPFTSTRGGFVESCGAAIHIITTAELAIKMGLPIYAVVGGAETATDREGRSVPAPGQGILCTAREYHPPSGSHVPHPLLELNYRKEALKDEMQQIADWRARKVSEGTAPEGVIDRLCEAKCQRARQYWGSEFWKGEEAIAPLRGALHAYGLTIDDLDVCSMHGTSTQLNDKNESQVLNRQLEHLGRKKGHPLFTIWQKWLTGHPKGAACGWMVNGLIQAMHTGLLPPQRNADNVDSALCDQAYDGILYSHRLIDVGRPLKAAMAHSFGFGQANTEILIIHPDYLWASAGTSKCTAYSAKRAVRQQKASQFLYETLADRQKLIQVKTSPPYSPDATMETLLNPSARASVQPLTHRYAIDPAKSSPTHIAEGQPSLEQTIKKLATDVFNAQQLLKQDSSLHVDSHSGALATTGCYVGVDVEPVSTFAQHSERSDFITRNFTAKERAEAFGQPQQQQGSMTTNSVRAAVRLAGRWCAKEAIVKAMGNLGETKSPPVNVTLDPSASLVDIEVLSLSSASHGVPLVSLYGRAAEVAKTMGVTHPTKQIRVSISHTDEQAVAMAAIHL